jgi:hypothetical protein
VPKLETLRDRARQAVNSKQFRELTALIPPGERDSPQHVLSWFRAAALHDPRGADTPEYQEATEALHELAEMQATVDRASAIYYGAISSGLVSQEEADRLWADPGALEAKLGELRGTDQYWENPLVQEAAALMYEARSMDADDAESEPAADPDQPSDEGDGARSGEQSRYLAIKGEDDPPPETEPVHPRDDDTPHLATSGPVI